MEGVLWVRHIESIRFPEAIIVNFWEPGNPGQRWAYYRSGLNFPGWLYYDLWGNISDKSSHYLMRKQNSEQKCWASPTEPAQCISWLMPYWWFITILYEKNVAISSTRKFQAEHTSALQITLNTNNTFPTECLTLLQQLHFFLRSICIHRKAQSANVKGLYET